MSYERLTKQQSDGKLPAPLGAASFEDATAITSGHALHETVFAFARDALGLPGTFHKNPDLLHLKMSGKL
jgi:hypothetical protein